MYFFKLQIRCILSAFFLLCLSISTAFSQNDVFLQGDTLFSIYKLEEIVIHGDRDNINSSMVTELKAEDIKTRNAINVTDVVKFDPGMTLTTGSKGETETQIRGLPSRDVLVLVDGRPINSGYYGKVDLSMIPLANIAKIKLIKGPASVAYGANTMGGVINIVTKNGLEVPKTVIETKFGDFQFRNLSINYSRKIGKFNYWISGYENHTKGFPLSKDFETKYNYTSNDTTILENGGLRENSFYHKIGFDSKIGFQPTENKLFALSLGYHWAKKDIPWAASDNPDVLLRYQKIPKWERYNGALSGNWQISPSINVRSILFADFYNDELIRYNNIPLDDVEENIKFDSLLESWTLGGIFDSQIKVGNNHNLHFGIHLKRDLTNKQDDQGEPWTKHHTLTSSLFLQDTYRPWKTTNLLCGLIYNLFDYEGKNTLSKKLSPMVSVNQELFSKIHLIASYANSIRFPLLHQLYSSDTGNPDLKPEYADKFEVGFSKWFLFDENRNGSLELLYFYNDIKNLIYRESKYDPYENVDRAKMLGLELNSRWRLNNYFSGEFSYGYIKTSANSQDRLKHNLLQYVPKNKFRFQLIAKTWFGTFVNYDVCYFDDREGFITAKGKDATILTLPNYIIHNLNIFHPVTKALTLRLEMSNFIDKNYQEEPGFWGPGRQVVCGFYVTF